MIEKKSTFQHHFKILKWNGKKTLNKSRGKPSLACSHVGLSSAASVDLVTEMRTELDISSGSGGEKERARPSKRPDSGKCPTGF